MFVELLSFDKIRQLFIVGLFQKQRKLCPIFIKIRNTTRDYVVKTTLVEVEVPYKINIYVYLFWQRFTTHETKL